MRNLIHKIIPNNREFHNKKKQQQQQQLYTVKFSNFTFNTYNDVKLMQTAQVQPHIRIKNRKKTCPIN